MTSKHTPGPWAFNKKYADNSGAIVGADNRSIAAISSAVQRDADEKLANGNLIAAAPELLERLKWAEQHIRATLPDSYYKGHPEFAGYDAIRFAIAKAEGRS